MPFRGDRLTGIREFKNLRRSDLARLAGRDPAGIQHLEEGTTRNPRLDTVETLAEKLDITTDYLSGVGPDLPYARAAVLQALERFKRTEGWKFSPLDEAALSRAAEHEDAFHTVAQWRSFVVMSSLAWGKAPRMLKLDHRTPASAQLPTRKAAEPGKDALSLRPFEPGRKRRT